MVGVQLLRRLSTLVFTLLTLYFVYLNRDSLERDVPRVGRRLFGPEVEGLMIRAVEAIRATVDGIVLVAVAEGAIMAGVYAITGAPHPILFGAVTGIFAMIPFAAPVVFGAVALVLASQNAVGAAIGVLVSGGVVLFVADHFVRPVIIGEGAKLPFLWVLLGILGGVESFGLVGIFLGPALMAALVAVWRSWVTEAPAGTGSGERARAASGADWVRSCDFRRIAPCIPFSMTQRAAQGPTWKASRGDRWLPQRRLSVICASSMSLYRRIAAIPLRHWPCWTGWCRRRPWPWPGRAFSVL